MTVNSKFLQSLHQNKLMEDLPAGLPTFGRGHLAPVIGQHAPFHVFFGGRGGGFLLLSECGELDIRRAVWGRSVRSGLGVVAGDYVRVGSG